MKLNFSKKMIRFTAVIMLSFCISSAFAYDVVVAKDGTGNYTTVAAAIAAAPTGRTTPYTIFIKNGKYREKDTVPSNKPFIQLIGESVANVIISWDDYSGKPIPGGGIYGTGTSATFIVNAADFAAINITFENTTGEQPQALAINVIGDRCAFKNCRFLGGQDTLFAGGNGARQNFRNCYIDGTVDFIFGDARAVFDSCVVYAKTRASAGASYITAANTKPTESYGYVFRDCVIPANRGGTFYYLGRPWQNDATQQTSFNRVNWINTTMSSSVQPAGWSLWDAGTDVNKIVFGEYRSKKFDSSLVDVSARISWSKQLTATDAAVYNNTNLFGTWNPCTVTADFCTYSPRPIAVSNFKGVKGASTSAFTWNISWPIAGVKYEVLRSSDRTTFTKVSEQTSPNDSTINYNYSESIPPPGQTYYYLIQASKTGYSTHISDTVTISSTPTINVTGAMGSFVQGVGTPSTSQSYTISAASLTNNLIITSPAGYELSTNGSVWNTSSNPLVFTQDAFGNIPNTAIFVRLNASVAGTNSGNITHTSTGADTVRLAVTGTVQSTPLSVSTILELWPMTVSNLDSAGVRSAGVAASSPTLNKLYLSNGTTVTTVPAYSTLHGQAFGPTPAGDANWSAPVGPGGTVNRTYYEQFTVTAQSTHSLRIDSLILTTSIQNSANGRFAAAFSKSGFVTDSTDLPGALFATPLIINNETAGNTSNLRFAFAGGTGINLASGEVLSIRLYYAVGSGSAGRYAKIKDVQVKGLATANPTIDDYRTHQTGDWTDLNTWERWNGTTWVNPATAYPVYNNANTTTILNGHTVTISATLANGSGYIDRTKINAGGQLIVNNGASLNIANDGAPSTATTDLQVDGTFTLFGGLFTNGNVSVLINGNFIYSGTNMNLSNTGDTLNIGPAAIYQHNANSNTTPARMIWQPGSTFLVTGITTSQTGLFKKTITYQNIIWNNTAQANYYGIQGNLDSANVKGSFTVQSTGPSTYLSFLNTSGRISIPGGFYQTGGIVNFRESGTVTDTLDLSGDFNVTGGTFNSNATTTGNSLLIRANGFNKTITYAQNGAANTNWQINGSYTLGSNLALPSATFGTTIAGTLNMGTYLLSGPGNVSTVAGSIISSGAPAGLDGNITATGTKIMSPLASYIFNGSVAQTTGILLPSSVNALTINNAADITLNGGSLIVTNGLTLTTGKLLLGNNSVTASSVLGNTSAKYVVTNGVGYLKINNIGAGANVFPVGPSGTSYNPVTLNNAGGSDNFSVNVKSTFDNPVPDANKVVNRQWIINEEVAGGSNVTVSLSWLVADQAAGFNPANVSSIIRFNGATWQAYPATITGAGTLASPYVATASGITSFSPFTVANDVALPLTLLSFNGAYNGREVNVTWTTTNEINTKDFVVERSADGSSFTSLGTVAAKNTLGINSYSFADANPSNGANYYRLRMVDKDGNEKYSKVVIINTKLKGIVSIYPNPATSFVTVTYGNAAAGGVVEIISADGRKMVSRQLQANSSQTTLNVAALSAGIYNLVLMNGAEKSIIKFVKQ